MTSNSAVSVSTSPMEVLQSKSHWLSKSDCMMILVPLLDLKLRSLGRAQNSLQQYRTYLVLLAFSLWDTQWVWFGFWQDSTSPSVATFLVWTWGILWVSSSIFLSMVVQCHVISVLSQEKSAHPSIPPSWINPYFILMAYLFDYCGS